jgi:hypothetical protein
VRGQGGFTIDGPRCCEGEIRGGIEMTVTLDSAGRATITQLQVDVVSFRITVRRPFSTDTFSFLCNRLHNTGPIAGTYDAAGRRLSIAPAAAEMVAVSFAELPAGAAFCPRGDDLQATDLGLARGLVSRNVGALAGTFDPAGDLFTLAGTFVLREDGETFRIHFDVAGTFVNRPPRARLATLPVGGSPFDPSPSLAYLPQSGDCPPLVRRVVNGQLAATEVVYTEANVPEGLLAAFYSWSSDPDGSWQRSDIVSEDWLHSVDGAPFVRLGGGRAVAPVLFERDRDHVLILSVVDRRGAVGRKSCRFRVEDGRAPTITAPPPLTLACKPGGVRPRDTPALANFLAAATAVDAVSPPAVALSPVAGGRAVRDDTLFSLGTTAVDFFFRDAANNLGSARSGVTVTDDAPPEIAVNLSPAVLPQNGRLEWVRATISTRDDCGPVSVILESITSNHRSSGPPEIRSANLGADDRRFCLRAEATRDAVGGPLDRVYTVTYRATDSAGNVARASAEVRVPARRSP